jgi:general secretion pathway protein N
MLGALFLWALGVLVLTLSGLGSRFTPALVDQVPPRLPTVSLTRSQSRLGPLDNYAQVGQRPLMNENRQPSAQVAVDGGQAQAELDVVLTSVLITPRLQMAILTGSKDGTSRRVHVGDTVEGSNWRLVAVAPRSATLEGPGGQRSLELRVFDGRSGEAPTPVPGKDAAVQPVARNENPPPPPQPQPVADAAKPPPADQQAAQQQQIESIRRRIEARRAQMRAEAESSSAQDK